MGGGQDEQMAHVEDEQTAGWMACVGRAALVSLGLAAGATFVVWLTGMGMAEDKYGETIATADSGLYTFIFLLVAAWIFPLMNFGLAFAAAEQTRLSATAFVFTTTILHAGILTASTLLWPYLAEFAASGLFVDSWQPSALHLLAVFLCCWTVVLAVTGATVFMVRMMAVQPIVALSLGGSWVLGSVIVPVVIGLSVSDVSVWNTTDFLGPVGVILAVVIVMVLCLMPLTKRSFT